MKKCTILLFLWLICGPLLGGISVPLPDLLAPNIILADNDRLYIADGTSVFIYSAPDYSLLKKFGREGEGPREFSEKIFTLGVQGEFITINSAMKLSFFTKDGAFVKETHTPAQHFRFLPVGGKFIGSGIRVDKDTLYKTINIYDPDLTGEKEIAWLEHEIQAKKGSQVFHGTLSAAVIDNKIFSTGSENFVIHVFDENGKKLMIIARDYERKKVTEEDKNRVLDNLKTNPETREYYEMLKPVKFAGYYPALREIVAADKKIYALTWKKMNETVECFVFDVSGKLLEISFLPIQSRDAVDFSPFTIRNDKIYQLVENETGGKWQLRITDIK